MLLSTAAFRRTPLPQDYMCCWCGRWGSTYAASKFYPQNQRTVYYCAHRCKDAALFGRRARIVVGWFNVFIGSLLSMSCQ